MEEEVRDAVFGNVGTTVVFRVGPFDAEALEPIFMPRFTKEDIVTLDKRQIYLTLMIDGVGSAPFSAVTIPPIEAPVKSYRDEVIASSQKQFTVLRAGIEKSIMDEFAQSAAAPMPIDARMRPKQASALRAEQRKERTPFPQKSFTPRQPFPQARQEVKTERETPRAPRTEIPTPRPLPVPERKPMPPVEKKNAEDLKAILRSMTAKTGAEREEKKSHNQTSLKGALATVLQKEKDPSPPASPKQESVLREQKQEVHKPFEVPEDKLREVLKGDT